VALAITAGSLAALWIALSLSQPQFYRVKPCPLPGHLAVRIVAKRRLASALGLSVPVSTLRLGHHSTGDCESLFRLAQPNI